MRNTNQTCGFDSFLAVAGQEQNAHSGEFGNSTLHRKTWSSENDQ